MHKILGLALLLLLTACTSPDFIKDPAETLNWAEQNQMLKNFSHWSISGRVSVQTNDDGGQADFSWQQNTNNNYKIRLQAPLGFGTTWIHAQASGISLKTSSGEEMYDTDVDDLIHKLNGWHLPVSGLRYWVRGIPAANRNYKITDWTESGLPEVMLQDGWRIEFRKHKLVSGLTLPSKLFISRQTMEEEIDVRLIIRQWKIL